MLKEYLEVEKQLNILYKSRKTAQSRGIDTSDYDAKINKLTEKKNTLKAQA